MAFILPEQAIRISVYICANFSQQIVTASISNETGIITVNVDSKNPKTTYEFTQAVSEISVAYTADIIEESSMKIVDDPELPKRSEQGEDYRN